MIPRSEDKRLLATTREEQAAIQKEELARYRESVGAGLRDWVANPGPQSRFLQCGAQECCYGGQAGGSKSEALLMAALSRVHLKGYIALLLRREFPTLKPLLRRAKQLYPEAGGKWYAGAKKWVFKKTGAEIHFGSAPHEDDVERYQGDSYAFIGFDELTHFTRAQYVYLFSRARSTEMPTRIRAATNPGSAGHDWVLERFAPWLYPPGELGYQGPRAGDGEVLFFKPLGEDEDGERLCSPDDPEGSSRTFIRSKLTDTPQLLGTGYERNLNQLSRIERKRLKGGDWMVRDVAGEYFDRSMFEIVDAVPEGDVIARLRYWDLAGTSADKATPSSAWTAGPRMAITRQGVIYIEHVARGQWSPGDVMSQVEKRAKEDLLSDPKSLSYIERDPAQAGKFQAWFYATNFQDLPIKSAPPQGDKLTRALIPSAQAEAGNIKLVRNTTWNEPFLLEAEAFPDKTKDQIDGLSGGFKLLVLARKKYLEAAGLASKARAPSKPRETSGVNDRSGGKRGGGVFG